MKCSSRRELAAHCENVTNDEKVTSLYFYSYVI